MRDDTARALASAYLAGEWSVEGLTATGRATFQRRPGWLAKLAEQVVAHYPRPPYDRPRELAAVIVTCRAAKRADRTRPPVRVRERPVSPTRMVTNRWDLPVLDDLDDLALMLRLDHGELDWFADPKRLARRTVTPQLQHYRVAHRVAASGAIRVLEAPKPRLKAIQRRLLERVLDRVPPHDAARGFRPGGSAHAYAAPHAGRAVVLHLDLEAFFASVTVGRVYGIWRTAGYPETVAHALAGLMTSVLPLSSWRAVPRPDSESLLDAHWRLGRRLAQPHLPQGAPTSPAVANLAAWRLDVRLTALAASWGGRYTRYADDLAFSGDPGWRTGTSRLLDAIETVVVDEGFRLNPRKTGVMPRAGRQHLAGLVVNERPRVSRAEVDRLRAILHNCARHGPASQNRDDHPSYAEHLRGRIAWVAQHDATRGARLLETWHAVDWES